MTPTSSSTVSSSVSLVFNASAMILFVASASASAPARWRSLSGFSSLTPSCIVTAGVLPVVMPPLPPPSLVLLVLVALEARVGRMPFLRARRLDRRR